MSTIIINDTATRIEKLMELIFSDPNVYGNWTPLDFAFHFDGLSSGQRIEFLEELIAEGDSWIQ